MKQLTGREDEKMDSFLRNALKEQAEALAIGPEQTERMCRGVYQRIEENSHFGSSSMFGWSNDRSGGRAGKDSYILLQPCRGFHGIQPAGREGRAAGT